MNSARSTITLASGGAPTAFRLFKAGVNDTTKGKFLFDAIAAKSVMAAYVKHGIDLPIDLEHQMLDDAPHADPTARDARGWCRLELRPDGSLWAVGVTWSPDGAARLARKAQRYVSPAFKVDPDTKRILSIFNIALVALPATHGTPALVAAAKRTSKMPSLDPKLVSAALTAVASKDAKGSLAVLQQILAALLGGSADDAPPSSANGGPPDSSAAPDPAAALSDDERAICAELRCDPSEFARLKARRDAGGAL